jgi:cytosine/adenosine deaminase-related metal-dependent hydrolase
MQATLYTARWVLPVASPPIADGGVVVGADGRIEAVGRAVELATDSVRHVALGAVALLPGLVNVHAHPDLTAFRGLLENLGFADWILTLMRVRRSACPSADDWAAAARWSCVEAMAAGITTTAATEESGASFGALRESGLRGIIYREVFGPDPARAPEAAAELRERVAAMRPLENGRVRVGVSPHAPYTVSDRLYSLVAEFARSERLPVATHAAEAAVEEALVVHGSGQFADGLRARGIATSPRGASTIALLERTGLLATQPLLIHCVRLTGEDVSRIAAAGAAVAHCPIANARLAHGSAPVEKLFAAGVRVGLGTDSVASNNRLDILEEARVAQLLLRARTADPTALPAYRLLELATIDGARALGLADEIGTIEAGKRADLCAIRLDSPHHQPVHDPVATVTLAARATDVVLTMVDGRVVYRDGTALTVDVAAVRAHLDAFATRLRAARDEARA